MAGPHDRHEVAMMFGWEVVVAVAVVVLERKILRSRYHVFGASGFSVQESRREAGLVVEASSLLCRCD